MKYDRITDHEDWKDGHDSFRLWAKEEFKSINRQLKEIRDGDNNTTRKKTKL